MLPVYPLNAPDPIKCHLMIKTYLFEHFYYCPQCVDLLKEKSLTSENRSVERQTPRTYWPPAKRILAMNSYLD